jgi:hypothetical protein
MKGNTYDPPPLGEPPQQKKKWVDKLIAIILTIIIIYGTYIWVTNMHIPPEESEENIIATLNQGDGNMTSGCLFTITNNDTESYQISVYRIRIGKKGDAQVYLKWPNDGNTTAYNIDSSLKSNDGEWWDSGETIGFDVSPELKKQNIFDGDTIEVEILNINMGDVVYKGEFIYHDN